MATIKIELKTDNSAFEDLPAEVARILRALADRVEWQGYVMDQTITDWNGNKVGAVEVGQ